MGRSTQNASRTTDLTAQQLSDYFIDKVDVIRRGTGESAVITHLQPAIVTFSGFMESSSNDIEKLILDSPSTSCSLDPVPTSILKEFLAVLLPFVTRMCNASLREGFLPLSQRHAIVSPFLKKPTAPVDEAKNYRPISTLTFISKLIERIACRQLTTYLETNNLLPRHQSGYRRAIQLRLRF